MKNCAPIVSHGRAPARVVRYAETQLPTVHGKLRCVVYRTQEGVEHVAMIKGDITGEDVLCRMHSECLTSEVLGSIKCDCKEQLDKALQAVVKSERGVVLYLRQEGRGIGLGNKIRAYALQEQGLDTVDANRQLGLPDDARDYTPAADMLKELGVRSVALMTNNPTKVDGLRNLGFKVTRRVPHGVQVGALAQKYVDTKVERMEHFAKKDVERPSAAVVPLRAD